MDDSPIQGQSARPQGQTSTIQLDYLSFGSNHSQRRQPGLRRSRLGDRLKPKLRTVSYAAVTSRSPTSRIVFPQRRSPRWTDLQ
jgi:hypothetical protein